MKYPYICKSEDGDVVFLISGKDLGIVLDDPKPIFVNETKERFGNTYVEDDSGKLLRGIKDITREYLQNTYGEVQSPEHAEFIIKLAENAGLEVYVDSPKINRSFFTFNESSTLFFYDSGEYINKDRCKQITIPLPPKADKQELSEWPQVGDEVCWSNGCYKGVVKARHWNDLWVMEIDGEFSTLYIDDVSKPKTPEEDLRDDIVQLIDDAATLESYVLVLALMNKYDIKKKPQ